MSSVESPLHTERIDVAPFLYSSTIEDMFLDIAAKVSRADSFVVYAMTALRALPIVGPVAPVDSERAVINEMVSSSERFAACA